MNPFTWIKETFKIERSPLPPHVSAALEAQKSLVEVAERTAEETREHAERLDQFARLVRSVQGRYKIHEGKKKVAT